MSLSLYWPGSYHWYPIGNTPPVCLTRDVPPESATNILLLACGDPRNIIYTVFCEVQSFGRSLDFTCCDFDPGILARNILLLTMIIDGVPEQTAWNIFYHMYLDSESRSTLVSQSQKLTSYASVEEWRSSPYGATIRMGTNHTFMQLRHHWELYEQLYHSTNVERLKALQEAMEQKRNAVLRGETQGSVNFASFRSSGSLVTGRENVPALIEHFKHYWTTGTTFTDLTAVAASTHPNSTFLYSRAGEGFDIHYGTDPMIPFHHAPALGNASQTLTLGDIVESAKSQFRAWCSAFRVATTTWRDGALAVRFILGDALSVSRTLQLWPSNIQVGDDGRQRLPSSFRLDQWTARTVELDPVEYTTFGAPVRFDVIDTSNLCDDVGIHNIFLCAIPLLENTPTSVLYTESLLTRPADFTTEVLTKIFADLPVVALLSDLAPVDALSGFTTRSDTHELSIARVIFPFSQKQYHQVLTWKRPTSGDSFPHPCPPMSIDTLQLSKLLHKIYLHLFKHEHPDPSWTGIDLFNIPDAFAHASTWCPSRESFVMLLALIHTRLSLSATQWTDVVRELLDILHNNAITRHLFDILSHNEIHVQLHRYGLYTEPGLGRALIPTAGRLSRWAEIPPLVRVFLTVPRDCFAKLERVSSRLPTPWLHCSIKHPRIEHAFQSADAAYGTVTDSGTEATPNIVIAEDHNAPTVVFSFVVPGYLLTQFAPDVTYVRIAVRTSPAASKILTPVLGSALAIFTVSLADANHVHLAPEQPLSPQPLSHMVPTHWNTMYAFIGTQRSVHVTLDASLSHIASLTVRLDIENAAVKADVAGGATPHISQGSPCSMQVAVGIFAQALVYPLPIVGDQRKVRIARKSSYFEVIVPVAIPFSQLDGYEQNPFPIVRRNKATAAWNLHRVPLDRLPVLNISPSNAAAMGKWYNTHISSQMSARESVLKASQQRDVDVLANVKDTLHFIMVRGAGTQGAGRARVIALRDDLTDDCDTIFFVDKFRFDVAAHTVVCDAFVLPLFPALLRTINPQFKRLLQSAGGRGVVNVRVYGGEMRAWKRLLPALVERCRTSWTHGANCEYVAAGKIPLELETGEGDPLCSCGRGKDVDGMLRAEDALWRWFASFVTRVAISPLFAVSYLDTTLFGSTGGGGSSEPASRMERNAHDATAVTRCNWCRKEESSAVKLSRCARCRTTFYCSQACQKNDWKTHKLRCGK